MRAASVALVLGGCTLALPYPSGVELCGNDIDDDFDGLLDCADDCMGACPEDDASACSDHEDDDLDGLVDYADPGCWPLANITLESCASVAATDAQFGFDGEDESWASSALAPDPTGTYTGLSFVPPIVSDDVTTDAQELTVLAGAVAGTRATMVVHLDPILDLAMLDLEVIDAIHDVARVSLTFGHQGLQILADTSNRVDLTGPTAPPLPVDWYELAIIVDDLESVTATASREGVEVARVSVEVAEHAWLEAHGFRVRVRSTRRAPTDLVVGEVHVTRPWLLPCGVPSPAGLVASGLMPQGLATFEGGDVCLTGHDAVDESGTVMIPFAPVLARSVDDGLTWSPDTHRELVTPSVFLLRSFFVGASIVDHRVHTLLYDSAAPSHVATSDDCASVEIGGGVPLGADLGTRGYAFDGELHEIFALDGDRLVSRRWPEGATHFERVEAARLDVPESLQRVGRHGSDLIVSLDGAPQQIAEVSTGARTFAQLRAFVDVVGSGRVGACDEYDVRTPLLTMDPTPRDPRAAATGIVVVRCLGRETYLPAVEGIATQRLVIRAPE